MSDLTRALLKRLLISRYAFLVKRLERVLGKENAADALHETWLRLETASVPGSITNADSYLLGMASNIAVDHFRREQRYVCADELEGLLELPDELSDPERNVAARQTVEALKETLRDLTPRRCEILLAARVEGLLNREIAEKMGISLRLVESELSVAMKHCLDRMDETGDNYPGATSGPRKF
jgi:RNA polymerase sigma factor (sigma-70 family)